MYKSLSLIMLVGLVMFTGCATTSIPMDRALDIPQDRILAKNLIESNSNSDVEVTFIRDQGMIGSGCYINIFYNDRMIFKLEMSEIVTVYIPEGEHILGMRFGDKGLCQAPDHFEGMVTVRKTRKNLYRIQTDNEGIIWIKPTGHIK